jgi:hypothetical protein
MVDGIVLECYIWHELDEVGIVRWWRDLGLGLSWELCWGLSGT